MPRPQQMSSARRYLLRRIARCLALALPAAFLLWINQNVFAANASWTGLGANGNWTTTGNWNPSVPGAATGTANGDTAAFAVNLNTSVTVDATRNIKNITFNTGAGAFSFSSGSLVLTNAGAITISSGVTNSQTFNSPILLSPTNGATYSFINNSTASGVALNINGTVTGQANETLTLDGTNDGNISGIISSSSGTLSLTKNGTGSWTLSGQNTYSGTTTLNAGTLKISNTGSTTSGGTNNALGTSNLSLSGGTLALRNDGAGGTGSGTVNYGNNVVLTGTATIDVNNVTSGVTNKTLTLGTLSLGANTLNVTGGNGYSLGLGAVTITAQSGATFNPTSASLTIASITNNGGNANATYTAVLDGTSTGNVVTGVIKDSGGNNNKQAVTKSNTSTWTLTGANTYRGDTNINGGTLLVNNTTGSGTGTGLVNVNNSGTLGGTGTISNTVTVASGATLNPGNVGAAGSAAAVGTLHTGALTLQSGSFSNFDVATPTSFDKLISSAAITFGGTLDVNIASGQTFTAGQTLDLFAGTSESGTFTGIVDGQLVVYDGYAFTADYTTTGFNLVAIPEPSTWFAAVLTLLSVGYTQRRKLVPALKRFTAALPLG